MKCWNIGIMFGQARHYFIILIATRPSTLTTRLFLQLLPHEMQQFIKLALHGDHLFAHVKRDLGSLEVHPHPFDEKMSHPNTLDLIWGINF